nr:TSUP family transporter [Chryseobacterium capnotolerans]
MSNSLYPVFLKLETLSLLIIGGGKIALEKLESVLGNSPETSIRLVAKEISSEVRALQSQYSNIKLYERAYHDDDFNDTDVAIIAVNDIELAAQIRENAHQKNVLVNIADKPELCDFYLGSIVKKGSLKIAISTNGKSPTIAKRLRETFTETIPDEMDLVLDNMQSIRNQLKGDFNHKVTELNKITTQYLSNGKIIPAKQDLEIEKLISITKIAQRKSNIYLAIIGVLLLLGIFGLVVYQFDLSDDIQTFLSKDGHIFYWMLFAGFMAEIVAGSMGMGYGVICTTILLLLNVPPPVVSASIHSAESFTTAAGGFSHYKLGNVNKKMVWVLFPLAIVGSIIGTLTLSHYGEHYAHIVKPIIACYTLYLGVNILRNAFKDKNKSRIKTKKKNQSESTGTCWRFYRFLCRRWMGPISNRNVN